MEPCVSCHESIWTDKIVIDEFMARHEACPDPTPEQITAYMVDVDLRTKEREEWRS